MNIRRRRFESLQVELAVWARHTAVEGNDQRSLSEQIGRGDQYAAWVCQREWRRIIACL
jgi:hypothetical protein